MICIRLKTEGHEMGFLKKFMMENAGAAAVRRLDRKIWKCGFEKHIQVFAGLGK